MAGNDTGEKKEMDPHTHLAEALNFDYFASIAPMVCTQHFALLLRFGLERRCMRRLDGCFITNNNRLRLLLIKLRMLQVTKALSQVNKERPTSQEEAASALSRALLSVGQDSALPPGPRAAPAEDAVGIESDSLDEESDEGEEDDA